eukprot:1303904-Pyramimonas_sp.AAC.1
MRRKLARESPQRGRGGAFQKPVRNTPHPFRDLLLGGEGIKGKGLPFDSMATWLDARRVDEVGEPKVAAGKGGQ